jgi:RND family efflux transporter MFP subunit
MNRKLIVTGAVVAVGLAVVGVAASGALGPRTPDITYLTAEAVVTDVRDTVSVSGAIRPVDEYGLAFGVDPARNPPAAAVSPAGQAAVGAAAPTWTVESVDVKAGDRVSAGDVLAVADPADAEVAVVVATANLEAARARLALDERPVSATARAQAKLGVTQANQQLRQARKAQSQVQSQGRLAIRQATAVLADARSRLAADRAAGAPSSVIDADELAVRQASRALASTRLQVSATNTQAANAVAAARLGVQSATLARQGTTDVDTDAAVAAGRAAVAQAESALADAQAALELATITAPIDGIVSSVDIQPGDNASGIVIRLRDPEVEVSASVTESDLPMIRVGQPAEIRIDALDADVTGSVREIDVAGATRSAAGVVSYGIVIGLDSIPELVAPGMTADVDITTASAPGVLAVPVTAIGGGPGAYTVQVLEGPDRLRTVPVEVGLLTAELAEITSGIDAGTEVVTGTVSARDLVTTFPTGPGGGGGAGGGSSTAAPDGDQP